LINIGNQRECFFDRYLINEEKTTAAKLLHKPIRRGVVLELDQPWEQERPTFFNILYAEGKWRMHYVCYSSDLGYIAYAESDDALHWERPDLGIVEYQGSRHNNIILDDAMLQAFGFEGFDNMSVFYDENPACSAEERYKMVAWWMGHGALVVLTSADGIHFTKCRLLTDDGAFDSQNRAFWSKAHGKYFCYYRGEHEPSKDTDIMDKSYTDRIANALYDPMRFRLREPGDGTYSFQRDVRVMESEDFIHWTPQQRIQTTGAEYQLYNNVVFPYPRAPHMLIGFPLRYVERKAWSKSYDELCGREGRLKRMQEMARWGLAISDGLFMCSRDGYHFEKYDEALIPPPAENPEAFVYGDGTASPIVIETPSAIPGAENEYTLFVRESFRSVESCPKLVQYTIRLDGFVSLHAGGEKVQAVTKEFVYEGKDLYANMATSARGSVYFTLTCGDESYTSCEMFGNSVDKRIRFEDDEIVGKLSGRPVTLTMHMFDCDVYSIRFA